MPHTTINEVHTTQFSILNKTKKVLDFEWTFKDFMKATVMFFFIYKEKGKIFLKRKIFVRTNIFFFHGKFSFISGLDTNFWKGWID